MDPMILGAGIALVAFLLGMSNGVMITKMLERRALPARDENARAWVPLGEEIPIGDSETDVTTTNKGQVTIATPKKWAEGETGNVPPEDPGPQYTATAIEGLRELFEIDPDGLISPREMNAALAEYHCEPLPRGGAGRGNAIRTAFPGVYRSTKYAAWGLKRK